MPVVPRFLGVFLVVRESCLVLIRHACGHVLLPMHYPRGGCLSVCQLDPAVRVLRHRIIQATDVVASAT